MKEGSSIGLLLRWKGKTKGEAGLGHVADCVCHEAMEILSRGTVVEFVCLHGVSFDEGVCGNALQ